MKTLTATMILMAVTFTLSVAADVPLATSSSEKFVLNTVDSAPFVVSNGNEAGEFADYPLTWKAGESVSVTAPDGTVTEVVTDAATDGSHAFAPTSGGVWKLVNSKGGMIHLCVKWDAFGDRGVICSSTASGPFSVDTMESGPSRKVDDKMFMPIAYSGDNWIWRSESASSTLTITPPADKGETVVYDMLTGTGILPFTFNDTGKWRVALETETGAMYTATVTFPLGLVFSVR